VLLHLKLYELSLQAYLAYIIAAGTFYGNPVALFEKVGSGIAEKVLTAPALEGNFYYREWFSGIGERDAAKPIKYVHAVATAR
jgi:hypothetical protein